MFTHCLLPALLLLLLTAIDFCTADFVKTLVKAGELSERPFDRENKFYINDGQCHGLLVPFENPPLGCPNAMIAKILVTVFDSAKVNITIEHYPGHGFNRVDIIRSACKDVAFVDVKTACEEL